MIELEEEKLNKFVYAQFFENWQIHCLRQYGNVLISQKHFDEMVAKMYSYLYGVKVKYNSLNKAPYLDKYIECQNLLLSHLETMLGSKLELRDCPPQNSWEVDCIIIECINENNNKQEVI